MNFTKLVTLSLVILSFSSVVSCSSGEEDSLKTEVTKKTAEDLYAEAKKMVENGRYSKAIPMFEEVERLYPFSNLAPKSQVMTAYSHYKNEDYDKAIGVIDSFVTLNPGNAEVDFMYYLKASSYYDRISDVKRDQDITEKAKSSFEEVIRRFPGSDYAKDSKYKIDLIRDHLAGKEMEIGRFYLRKKKYIAAVNRFKEVFDKYEDTPQIEEALYRLVESNKILGLSGEAKKYASILGHNYPESKWYKRSYSLVNGGAGSQEGDSSSFFSGWFGSGDDKETSLQDLHRSNDSGKLEKLFKKEIN